jgi:hypothetical protein
MPHPQTLILNAKLATPTSSPNLARPRVALLAPRWDADVIGVGASAARFDATGKLGLDVRMTNGEAPDCDNEFDAVFSNAALHWMSNPANVENWTDRSMNSQARVIGREVGRAPFWLLREFPPRAVPFTEER